MAWSDVVSVVSKLAPMIATGLGGPLAGGAVTMLEGVFGLTPDSTATIDDRQAALANAVISATPDQLLALKKADNDYAIQMATLGFKDTETLASLAVQDIVSARTMQSETKSWMPAVLTIAVTVGFFGMLSVLMFFNVPEANKPLVFSFTGTLGAVWLASAHFWFGDTQSGARTTELLAQSTPAK